jgi:phosphatidylethanolamine-binding protein
VTQPGAKLSNTDSATAPQLSTAEAFVKPEPQKYFVISLDLDAPFPSMPILGPIMHGMEVDVVASGPATDGWVVLSSTGDYIFPYISPNPPPGSNPHRYMFLVYEQPAEHSAETVRKALGLSRTPGMTARLLWNLEDLEKKIGLQKIIVGNYWVSGP